MVRGLLSMAVSMAAWQTSAIATKKAVEWGSSIMRRSIVRYAQYLEHAPASAVNRAGRRVFEAAAERISPRLGMRNITEHAIDSTVKRFRKNAGAYVKQAVTSRMAPGLRRAMIQTGRALKDEISYLPANYIMYRMEKHSAVNPEERKQSSNFVKWYMGSPAIFSLTTHVSGQKIREGAIRRQLTRIAKEHPKTAVSAVKGVMGAMAAMNPVAERMTDMLRARSRMTEGRGVLGIFQGGFSLRNFRGLRDRFVSGYRRERFIRATGRGTRLGSLEGQLNELETVLLNTQSRRKYGKNFSELSEGDKNKVQNKRFKGIVREIREKNFSAYEREIEKRSSVSNFINRILEDAGTGAKLERQTAYANIRKGKKSKFASDPSQYSFEGKEYNLGSISITALRDSISKKAHGGSLKFGLSLFGQQEMVQQMHSENALGSSFRIGRAGRLFFPFALTEDLAGAAPLEEIAYTLMGTSSAQLSKKAVDDPKGVKLIRKKAKDFMDSRLQIFMDSKKGPGLTREAAEIAVKRSALHNELRLGSDDFIIKSPGGDMSILTHVNRKGRGKIPVLMPLSGGPNGIRMQYHQFTSMSSSLSTKVIRNWAGSEAGMYATKSGEEVLLQSGPTPVGKIERNLETKGILGRVNRFLEWFEGSYAQEQSVISRVKGMFSKFTDPKHGKTFFSKDHLRNKEFIDEVFNPESAGRGIKDMIDTLDRTAQEASKDFWHQFVRRRGGTGRAVEHLEGLFKHLVYDPRDYMLNVHGNLVEAKMAVDELHQAILTLAGNENSPYNFLREELKVVKNMQRRFHDVGVEGTEKDLFQVMGHLKEPESRVIMGKRTSIPVIDQYNSDVLRITLGMNQIVDTRQAGLEQVINARTAATNPAAFIKRTGASLTKKEETALEAVAYLSGKVQTMKGAFAEFRVAQGEKRTGILGNIRKIVDEMSGRVPYEDPVLQYQKAYPLKHMDFGLGEDMRLKVEAPEYDEIFLIPKTRGTGPVSRLHLDMGGGETVHLAQGIMDANNIAVTSMFHAFNRVGSWLGIGFDESTTTTVREYLSKMGKKRVLPMIGIGMAYSAVSRVADLSLDGSPLGEGLTVFGANLLAGARVAAQGLLDLTGVTSTAKYLEDLMPGSISSPASGILRGFGPLAGGMMLGARFGPRNGLRGGMIGAAVGALLGGGPLGMFGEWDISTSRKELVQELTGQKEIAIRKGRFWELGGTPFEGTRIQYFRPHMYAMMRSDYKHTPNFKDSLMTEMVGALAPDIYAMKNYYSRPYPVSAGLFAGMPVFSSMMQILPGSNLMTGAGIPMHTDQMNGSVPASAAIRSAKDLGMSTESIARTYANGEEIFGIGDRSSTSFLGMGGPQNRSAGLLSPAPMERSSLEYALGETVMNMEDILGIRGFMAGSLFTKLTGRNDLFDYAPEMADAADIAGVRRSYWDMELGGLLGASEALRRYIPHKRNQIEVFNPIRNTMPEWLPGIDYYQDFRHGDPYTVVPMGEARLPGSAYETLHNVDLVMPREAEILGEEADSQAAYYLGLPAYMADRNGKIDALEAVKANIPGLVAGYGQVVRDQTHVYEPHVDMHAYADAMVRNSSGETLPLKIMPKGLAGESAMNAFLVLSNSYKGILVEVDAEKGGVTERLVRKDTERFEAELQRQDSARSAALGQIRQFEDAGKAMNLANAYSWFDRFRILADVAPYSREYRRADAIVQQQIQSGRLGRNVSEYEMIKEQVEEKNKPFDFAEYRFADRGSPTSEYGKEMRAFHQNEYSTAEQMVGAAWERFSHLRTPVHAKLLHKTSALEEYERNAIYGKQIKMWENPIEDFIKSYAYQSIGEKNPFQGALSMATGGMLLGGVPLAIAGSVGGAALSTFNSLTGRTFIPERTRQRREVSEQADAVKYVKYRNLYAQTGNQEYLKQAGRTMTGMAETGEIPDPGELKYAIGAPERYYVEDIINNATQNDFGRIMSYVPEYAKASLFKNTGDFQQAGSVMNAFGNAQLGRSVPELDSSVYSPDVPIETPLITTMEQEGMNAHDAGAGWYSQMAALTRSKQIGLYHGEGLYASKPKWAITPRDLNKAVNVQGQLRLALGRYADNINIFEDGADRVEVEVVRRS